MFKKALAVTGWMVLAVALSPAHAAPPLTHLNQPAISDHVMLIDQAIPGGSKICGTLSFQDRAFFQAFPDGTLATRPFEVPENSNLVITDVEWSAYGGPLGTNPLAAGNTLRLRIFLAVPMSSVQVFSSRGITLDTFSATGRPGSSEQLTAGFVVDPRVTICPTVSQLMPSSTASVYIDSIILRGYVIPKG
jgi:hypothetical protein